MFVLISHVKHEKDHNRGAGTTVTRNFQRRIELRDPLVQLLWFVLEESEALAAAGE